MSRARACTRPPATASAIRSSAGCVGRQVRREAALVAQAGGVALLLQHGLERVVDLGAGAQRLAEGRRADRRDHELLDVHVGVGVRAAVEDVHHRHRQQVRVRAAEVAEQAQLGGLRGGLGDRERDAEDRVGAERATCPACRPGRASVWSMRRCSLASYPMQLRRRSGRRCCRRPSRRPCRRSALRRRRAARAPRRRRWRRRTAPRRGRSCRRRARPRPRRSGCPGSPGSPGRRFLRWWPRVAPRAVCLPDAAGRHCRSRRQSVSGAGLARERVCAPPDPIEQPGPMRSAAVHVRSLDRLVDAWRRSATPAELARRLRCGRRRRRQVLDRADLVGRPRQRSWPGAPADVHAEYQLAGGRDGHHRAGAATDAQRVRLSGRQGGDQRLGDRRVPGTADPARPAPLTAPPLSTSARSAGVLDAATARGLIDPPLVMGLLDRGRARHRRGDRRSPQHHDGAGQHATCVERAASWRPPTSWRTCRLALACRRSTVCVGSSAAACAADQVEVSLVTRRRDRRGTARFRAAMPAGARITDLSGHV